MDGYCQNQTIVGLKAQSNLANISSMNFSQNQTIVGLKVDG